jgi:PST family polysaccharide transporter
VIPLFFGSEWVLSAKIFPLLALGALVSSLFDLHAAVLHAAGKNGDVAKGNLLYVGLLWLGGIVLLPLAGLWGYGVSELLALPGFVVIHNAFKRSYGAPDYRQALWVALAAIPPLVASFFLSPLPAFSVFIVSYGMLFLLNGELRACILELSSVVLRKRSRSTTSACADQADAGASGDSQLELGA